MTIKKVFISYSHDDINHKKWTLNLATLLRKSGVDASIDQWDLQPGDDVPLFMEKKLTESDYVLLVCTDRYVEKANEGKGGVGYEKMILTSDLLSNIDTRKIIPIMRQNGPIKMPVFIKTKLYIDFSVDEKFEYNFDELIRVIHGSPLFEKPPIGDNPFADRETIEPVMINDPKFEIMSIVSEKYEKGQEVRTPYIMSRLNTSRIYTELLLEDLKKGRYINLMGDKIILRTEGKRYIVEHKIV